MKCFIKCFLEALGFIRVHEINTKRIIKYYDMVYPEFINEAAYVCSYVEYLDQCDLAYQYYICFNTIRHKQNKEAVNGD